MSKIVETALSGLRENGLEKLGKLDNICDGHLAWLAAAVGDVKRQIAETGHVAKKHRVGVNSVDNIAGNNVQVCRRIFWKGFIFSILVSSDRQLTLIFLSQAAGANQRRVKRGRGGHKELDTVAEENDFEQGEQEKEGDPIAVPEPSPAPKVSGAKPAAKVTRAKRGKKAKVEPLEDSIAAPVEPVQDGKLQHFFCLIVGKFASYFFSLQHISIPSLNLTIIFNNCRTFHQPGCRSNRSCRGETCPY